MSPTTGLEKKTTNRRSQLGINPMAESWFRRCMSSSPINEETLSSKVPLYSSDGVILAVQEEGICEMMKLFALNNSVSLASGISLRTFVKKVKWGEMRTERQWPLVA